MKKAIICDLDGTLAHLNGRDPYDASDCGNDILNSVVANILYYYRSMRPDSSPLNPTAPIIILCSGRFDTYRQHTMDWLEKHNISYDYLFMRKASDKRMDAIIKQEILFETIYGELGIEFKDIDFVMDDRDQVVDMWRAHDIPCLQVAPGDF